MTWPEFREWQRLVAKREVLRGNAERRAEWEQQQEQERQRG